MFVVWYVHLWSLLATSSQLREKVLGTRRSYGPVKITTSSYKNHIMKDIMYEERTETSGAGC